MATDNAYKLDPFRKIVNVNFGSLQWYVTIDAGNINNGLGTTADIYVLIGFSPWWQIDAANNRDYNGYAAIDRSIPTSALPLHNEDGSLYDEVVPYAFPFGSIDTQPVPVHGKSTTDAASLLARLTLIECMSQEIQGGPSDVIISSFTLMDDDGTVTVEQIKSLFDGCFIHARADDNTDDDAATDIASTTIPFDASESVTLLDSYIGTNPNAQPGHNYFEISIWPWFGAEFTSWKMESGNKYTLLINKSPGVLKS